MPDTPDPSPSDALPEELADLLFGQLLAAREEQRTKVLEELCRLHPTHAAAMRSEVLRLQQAEEFLGRDEGQPAAPEAIGGLRVRRQLGEGAFSVVYLCDQEQPIRRQVAVKVLRPGAGSRRTLLRFEAERQILALMSHPAITHVIDAGVLKDGRPYFVMEFVDGAPITHWCDERRLTVTARLELMLSLCDGVQYAHQKGIIHRDLKPSNVLVVDQQGRAQPKIIDFGLAKALYHELPHGIEATEVGRVLGTPGYMSPEQAEGRIADVDTRSDVFSLGVILYVLLTGELPWRTDDPRAATDPLRPSAQLRSVTESSTAIAARRSATPRQLATQLQRDLDWIVLKALERECERRYQSAFELAEDLRRYLRTEPVLAGPPSTAYRVRRWVQRNRALAAAGAAGLGVLLAALVVISFLLVEAEEQRGIAARRADDVLSLSAAQDLQELVARADSLWPVEPARIAAFEVWLRDARELIDGRAADRASGRRPRAGLADHRRKLAEIEQRALPAVAAEGAHQPSAPPRFASTDDSWWHSQLAALVADLEAFADPATGLCSSGTDPVHGWGVQRRLEFARTIAHRSVDGPEAAARWREAIAAIADPAACPRYGGLRIAPQPGLLPIGRDPRSGLWEFAHLATGEPAVSGADGTVALRPGDGLVLVLIPGGSFRMGAQSRDPGGGNHDPEARPEEAPVHEVALAPFFLSKFELTQDQWERFAGSNPSTYGPETRVGDIQTTVLHPVEQVSWRQADETMRRLELQLPTEAQWEYAARAGSDTPWWTGRQPQTLAGAANLADAFARHHGGPGNWAYEDWLDDGRTIHAPVGSYRANGNGLFDMAGNVYELCRDGYATYDAAAREGTGERPGDSRSHMIRGGGYHSSTRRARVSSRADVPPDYRDFGLGVRPARVIRG